MAGSMQFNPFGSVTIRNLNASHLARLVDVQEGWFVEYKEAPCKPKDYAKEAAAFANTRGGWIFIGLKEDSATRRPAGGPGIPTAEAVRLLDSARDGIIQNLSPAPRIDLAVVHGPIPELGIAADASVLIIHVPQSANPPHVHCSGRVYKRQADAAQPVELTNRAELDELYSRTTRHRELLDERLNMGFDDGWAAEISAPWLHLALIPDQTYRATKTLSYARFREIVGEVSRSIHILLPNAYSSNLGYIARDHTRQRDPTGAATTLEYGHHGRIYVTLALSTSPLDAAEAGLLNSENGRKFAAMLRRQGFQGTSQIIDGTAVATSFCALGGHAFHLLKEQEVTGKCLTRLKLCNMFRRVPFFESAAYVAWCEQHGPPIVVRDRLSIPSHAKEWQVDDLPGEWGFNAQLIHVLTALGLPRDVLTAVASETVGHTLSKAERRE